MAYLLQDDDEQNQQGQQGQQIAGPQGGNVIPTDNTGQVGQPVQNSSGQASGQLSGTGQSSSQAPQQASDQKGTGFRNVSEYINQNKNQSQGLADRAAGAITNKIDTAKSNINNSATSFQDQVQQNTVNLNQDVADRAAQDAYQFSQNQGDVDQFKNMYAGQYKGPQSFEGQDNYQDILSGVNQAKDYAKLADNESGRTEILKSLQQNNTKSNGMAALDNLLLQTNQGASDTLKSAASGAFSLDDFLQSISGQQNQNVQNARDTSQQTAQGLQERFQGQGGVYDQFVGGLDQRVTDARTRADATTQSILDQLANGTISPDQASYLGLDEQQLAGATGQIDRLNYLNDFFGDKGLLGEEYRGTDLSPYASRNSTSEAALSRQNVGTQDDFMKLQALSDLLGTDNNVLQQNEQLGTASDDLVDFDLNNFMSDYGQNVNTRESALDRYNMLSKEWDSFKGNSKKQVEKRAYSGVKARNLDEYLKQRGFSVNDSSLEKIHPWRSAVPGIGL